MKEIKLIIDWGVLDKYYDYYFGEHPRAKKKPIKNPYHESINAWMILQRQAMNSLKQKWKDFIVWYIADKGYADMGIEQCEIEINTYFPTARKHDPDNYVPKFILDGFVESGFIKGDDCLHITKLSLACFIKADEARTEIIVKIQE